MASTWRICRSLEISIRLVTYWTISTKSSDGQYQPIHGAGSNRHGRRRRRQTAVRRRPRSAQSTAGRSGLTGVDAIGRSSYAAGTAVFTDNSYVEGGARSPRTFTVLARRCQLYPSTVQVLVDADIG